MADMLLEQCEDFEELRGAYHAGLMTTLEAYEHGIVDELGYEFMPQHKISKTCRVCKTPGLHWGQVDGRWRLFDGDEEHVCPEKWD